MITFKLNDQQISYKGDENLTLLKFLRNDLNITTAKDGCSAQAACGACTVEINGKAKLACVTKMKTLHDAEIYTMDGIPAHIKDLIATTYVNQGAVQCGFCTPGFIMRTKVLLQENPNPTLEEVQKAIKPNICRCTGYKKIETAIIKSADYLQKNETPELRKTSGKMGERQPKYRALQTAKGERHFVDDLRFDEMLHSALKFSDYPRAIVKKIDYSEAEKLEGVVKVFTAKDIPGQRKIGLIYRDWSVMICEGGTTHYIGDVLAGVVAETEEIARRAVALIKVDYEILSAVTDVFEAEKDQIKVHKEKSNTLDISQTARGNVDEALKNSAYVSKGRYETQRIEHAFLEKEAAIARPDKNGGLELLSQSQGVYEDRRQVAEILNLPQEKVRVTLIPNGGGFGGKEDMSVQGHVSLYAFLLQKTVKLVLTREESIKMHPKRHPVFMDYEVAADENGKLTAVRLRAWGDTGAYASVGTKVLERVAGHATGGYYVPNIDIQAKTIYTNNIPCGAMRGFGANQAIFALETAIDEICEKGNFDRWQFRYDNALVDGLKTATGQKVYQVGIRQCLLELKDEFYKAKYAGIATGIKNSGVGNGMIDSSDTRIEIVSANKIIIKHGWTEMGQGINTVAIQMLCEETGISPEVIDVEIDTEAQIQTGMTTSSRATALLGNAIIDAAQKLKEDLKTKSLTQLAGNKYSGGYACDWTTKPGLKGVEPITHYSYGYAAQLCVLNNEGKIDTFHAAHDAGKIVNRTMFEGQVEGAVHMGIGYALQEDLPMKDGYLVSDKYRKLNILRAGETPKIKVYGVEVADAVGPYGVKGIGEIGLVPTAGAVANAIYQFDKIRRYKLPLFPKK